MKATSADAAHTPYQPTTPATTMPDNLPLLLDTRTFAELANISTKHVRDLLAKGVVKGVRLGTAWRIPRDEALVFLGLSQ